MSQESIDRIIRTIAATQHIQAETISIDSTLEELKIDSLDGINILFALENEFNINVPDENAKGLRTIRDIVEAVDRLIPGGAEPAAV